jgi:hypothetical protein
MSDQMMTFIQILSPVLSGAGVYFLTKHDQKKKSSVEEISAIREDVRDIKDEMYDVRLAINELANKVGNNIYFPKKNGGRSFKNGL